MNSGRDENADSLRIEGFQDGACYDDARPDYPAEAIECFRTSFDLGPGRKILDLGAGTGKLTRQLIPLGVELIAVEPSGSMLAELSRRSPEATAFSGTAEEIPLGDGSVDVVFVAQSFHWFDAERALAQIARVLRQGGGLGLVWSERDESVEWVRELSIAMRWHERQPYEVGSDFRPMVTATGLFGDAKRHRFSFKQPLDHAGLLRRVETTSYIAALDPTARAQAMRPVKELVAGLPRQIQLPYTTDLYTFRLQGGGDRERAGR